MPIIQLTKYIVKTFEFSELPRLKLMTGLLSLKIKEIFFLFEGKIFPILITYLDFDISYCSSLFLSCLGVMPNLLAHSLTI